MLKSLLLSVLSIFYFRLMIYAHVPRYFLENTIEIDESIEEGSKGKHNVEERGKARVVTPPPSAPLKAKNAINKHFYSKTAELSTVELIGNPILDEKRITKESLDQYKIMELLLGMASVELALFAEQYDENLVKEFYRNLIGTGLEEDVDLDEVTKVLIGDAGAIWPETNKLNSNLMKMPYRALFRLICSMLCHQEKDQYLHYDLQENPQADKLKEGRFTRQKSSKKKQSSIKLASPSPPPPSADFPDMTTSLDLLNQKLFNVMALVLQIQQDSKNLKDKLP
ncbi:hypothetical protein M9H77_19459 [Catharanthus roseus]|uniref:Uncharacterized protein n=1 Tax=Catharanthus roseus TaxID=4058 RepID=A0ACC0BAD8_CATRO|nr:hypothetical protein M9H77_19459 [Catharanthus roseus]